MNKNTHSGNGKATGARKKNILKQVLLLLALSSSLTALGQTTQKFDISIVADELKVTSVQQVAGATQVQFSDPGVTSLLSNYAISAFYQPYPTAIQEELRNIWRVETASPGLMSAMLNYNSHYFPEAHAVPGTTILFVPDDYPAPGSGNYSNLSYLDMIHAPQAWDITQGSAATVMGITDPGGILTGHPDLAGKFANIRSSNSAALQNSPASNYSHGVKTAGIMAAGTNNGVGIPSIGFNNRLDIGGACGVDELHMAQDGVRVINCSWLNTSGVSLPASLSNSYWNEIYENGTSMVFAAGNGYNTNGITPVTAGNQAYAFPASYDHNLSITSVGHLFNTGTYNFGTNVCGVAGQSGGYSWKEVAEYRVNWQDCASEFTTNDKVDLCAPGGQYGLSTTYSGSNTTSGTYYYDVTVGTSYSAPVVAGTVGLMLTANKYLSPYQVEHILKSSASQDMFGIWPNTRAMYQGKLGAGRLDAGAAVTMANSYPDNTPETQSLFITGIQITSLCDPATLSANGFGTPMLFPHIENYYGYPGVPVSANTTMTYLWEPVPGNGATLSCTTCMTPNVVSMEAGNNRVWYKLTAYETGFAGQPVKVAHKTVKLTLDTNPGPDIVISDSYADNFMELATNNQAAVDARDWDIWKNKDLWTSATTQYNDQVGQGATLNQLPAQINGNYSNANVIIRNVGCGSYSGSSLSVKLYGAIPATAHAGNDWQLIDTKSVIPSGSLNPGAYIIRGFTIADPNAFAPVDCILTGQESKTTALQARIVDAATGLVSGVNEDNITARNVRNSKKIATSDFVNINLSSDPTPTQPLIIPFEIGNNTNKTQAFTIKISSLKSRFRYLAGKFGYRARLQMCPKLAAACNQTTNITVEPDGTLNLGDLSGSTINNLVLLAGRSYSCKLIIDMPAGPDPQAGTQSSFEFNIAQHIAATDERIGNVSFLISSGNNASAGNNNTSRKIEEHAPVAEKTASFVHAFPNPTTGIVHIETTKEIDGTAIVTVSDIIGKQLLQTTITQGSKTVDISGLPAGNYLLRYKDASHDEIIKLTKY